MRLPPLPSPPGAAASPAPDELPLWPPLLATRGPGGRSQPHAHHAMHLVLATRGLLRTQSQPRARVQQAAGVLTAPDVAHSLDATGVEVVLVFLDPESEVGAALRAQVKDPATGVRLLSPAERDQLLPDADPRALLGPGGAAWTSRAVEVLGGPRIAVRRALHPRVRQVLRLLRAPAPDADTSLQGLASAVGLSAGRLMHVFTASIGVPLRPYIAWCKLQRAAGAIVGGTALAQAAAAAGFADAAHMTRTFRRMFGIAPSALRPARDPP